MFVAGYCRRTVCRLPYVVVDAETDNGLCSKRCRRAHYAHRRRQDARRAAEAVALRRGDQCPAQGKFVYLDLQDAQDDALVVSRRFGEDMEAYQCSVGVHFHLRTAAKQRARRRRRNRSWRANRRRRVDGGQ